jgi:tetratricopeptide (TPR) repeat protein
MKLALAMAGLQLARRVFWGKEGWLETMLKCVSLACATLLLGIHAGLAQQASRAGANAAEAAPSDAVRRALTLEQQGNFTDALAAWEMVVKAEPRNGRAYAQLGLLEARQEHYAQAIADYRKAETLNPAIPQLKLNLGLAYFKSGEFRSASKVFEAELAKHPKGADAARLTILIGMSHYGAREYGAAIPYLKAAAAADQRNLPLRLSLAHCYLWTKQLDATMGVYKEILTIDPDSAEANMIAGEALDERGDGAGAVQQFQAAVLANPKEPNAHFGLAYLLWTQKRYEDAIPEFNAELQNDPKNYQAMLFLGDTYVRMEVYDKAKEMLEKAAAYQGSDPLLHLDMGIVYQETGDAERAAHELEQTIKLEPDGVNAHFRLGQVYRSMGKRDESKAEFAKASSLNRKTDESLHKRIADANARPAAKAEPDPRATPDKP